MATRNATMVLETPIARDGGNIDTLVLRKPASGELRGLSLAEITTMQADAIIALLPRITSPSITSAEAAEMDVADLFACGLEIAGFFLPAAMKPPGLTSLIDR